MADDKDYQSQIVKRYEQLKNRKLPAEQGEEIWVQLRRAIDEDGQEKPRPRRKYTWNLLLSIAAAGAAVVAVTVGLSLGHRLMPTRIAATSNQSSKDAIKTSPVLSPTQPLEVVTSNWRAVLSRCLKPGTEYQINIYYKGRGKVPLSSVIINGEMGTFNAAKDLSPVPKRALNHGEMVIGWTDLTFKDGLQSVKPLKVTWTENGVIHHKTLNFQQARADIKVKNDYRYYGEDANWKVSLEYETLTAPGFQEWNSNVVVTRKKGTAQSVWFTLASSLGKYHWGYQTTPGEKSFEMGLPNQKVTHITQPAAKMTITDGGQSDTVTLKRQNAPSKR